MEKLANVIPFLQCGDVLCFFKSVLEDRYDHEKFVVNFIHHNRDGKPDSLGLRTPKGNLFSVKINRFNPDLEVLCLHNPGFVRKTNESWYFAH